MKEIAINTQVHFWDIKTKNIQAGVITKAHNGIWGKIKRYYSIQLTVGKEIENRYVEEEQVIPHNIF